LPLALLHHLLVSRSSPSLACLLLSPITRLSLALLHHSRVSHSFPSLACLSLFSITCLSLSLSLLYHLHVS
jgi:hypothetical protein